MPLTDYSGLKTAIESFSGSKDSVKHIDDFIDLCEIDMYSFSDEAGKPIGLRVRDMETRSTLSTNTSDQFVSLPSNYIEQRRLKIKLTNRDKELGYLAPELINTKSSAGIPSFYTVTSELEFDRISDQVYSLEMQFYARLTALSASNTANGILTRFPTVYLYGSLYHLFVWSRDLEEQQNYRSKFISAIKGANQEDRRGRRGVAPKMGSVNRCLP